MIKVLGHRASRGENIYENTILGVKEALSCVDGIEIDAALSQDKELFMIHDSVFCVDHARYELTTRLDESSRTAVGDKRIDELSSAEIEKLILIDGQSLPSMSETLRLIKGNKDFIVNIELKYNDKASYITNFLQGKISEGHITKEQILISSFNHPLLEDIRAADDSFKIGMLYPPSNTCKTPMYPWTDNKKSFYTPFSREALHSPFVNKIQPEYICLSEMDLLPDNVKAIKGLLPDTKLFIWWYGFEPLPSENTALSEKLENLDKAGLLKELEGIITDYPRAMKATLT